MEEISQKSNDLRGLIHHLLAFEELIYNMYAPVDYFDTWIIMVIGEIDDQNNEYHLLKLDLTNWEIFILMKITILFEDYLKAHKSNSSLYDKEWEKFHGLNEVDYNEFRRLRSLLLSFKNFKRELMKMLDKSSYDNFGWWNSDRIKKLYDYSLI